MTPLRRVLRAVIPGLLLFFGDTAFAAEPVAQRIVTLAPHLAELVHSAGAADRLVGISAHTDRPQSVLGLPIVGDAFLVDVEQLTALDPDLVLAWESGTPGHRVDELRRLGFRVITIRTQGLDDIAAALRDIGRMTGQAIPAELAAERFEQAVTELRATHAGKPAIRVFYQVSPRPLYTVNGAHYISELIELCGGVNVFAGLGDLAPAVSEESVLLQQPEVMLAAAVDAVDLDPFADWRRWETLPASRYDALLTVDGSIAGRATTRLVEAGAAICARLDEARDRRSEVTCADTDRCRS